MTEASPSRSSRIVGSLLLFLAFCALVWPPIAQAKCATPKLSLTKPIDSATSPPQEPPIRAGQQTTVYGEWFRSGCNDTGGGPCSGEKERPIKDIELVLIQGGRSWSFGERDAKGRYFAVNWDVAVPKELSRGPAVLRATAKDAFAELPIDVE